MIDQWDKHSYLIDDRLPGLQGFLILSMSRAYRTQRIDGYARALTLFGSHIRIQQQRDKEMAIEWSWNRILGEEINGSNWVIPGWASL